MKQKAFPRVVYVARENQGTKDEFLNVQEDLAAFAEVNGSIRIGKYELVEIGVVEADAKYAKRS